MSWTRLTDRSAWPEGIDEGAIRAALPLLQESLAPAPRETFAVWIEFLLSRYRARNDNAQLADMDKRMWLDVLGHWPTDVLQAAVNKWCAEDRPFGPNVPGELKPLGEHVIIRRTALKERAERMLSAPALHVVSR